MKFTSLFSVLLLSLLITTSAVAQNDIKLNRTVGTKRNGDNVVLETTRTNDKDRLHVIAHTASESTPGATPNPNTALTVQGSATGIPLPASDAGPAWTTVRGVAGVPFASADQHSAVASVTDAPASGKKLVVTDIIISVDTDMSVTLKEETSGAVVQGPIYLAANSTVNLITRSKLKLGTANKKLQVITSVAGNISVNAFYYSEL